jgi:hypothetical protein
MTDIAYPRQWKNSKIIRVTGEANLTAIRL